MQREQIIVVKLGTSVLTGGTDKLDKAHMVELVRQCCELKKQGHQVVIVSSGAVAAGREQLLKSCGTSLADKQMLAAIGQGQLIHIWQSLFALYGVNVGQMLLTRADVDDRERYLNARDTLTALLSYNVVPIINENDAVATSEIKVGDNDNLSALVAILANADKLLLLTDQDGLFTSDPRTNADAKLIDEVTHINDELRQLAGGSGTNLGTGGMATKLQAADIARRAGVEVIIAKGAGSNVILKCMSEQLPGTRFLKLTAPKDGRKKWLLAGPKSNGQIAIDAGAIRALQNNGASLLAKGVTCAFGDFERGDLIDLIDTNNQVIARGLTRFSRSEVNKIKGAHSKNIAQLLSYDAGAEVLHRDDLVLL
ncbi:MULTISPECIES: glutamate 5-kinase [unclassified Pseudoalteromonas]|uniref:glutamate 5-kinase n=1 Tax=Pseudoalteromonas sp. S554 TaxID=2066516 RepID=UPI000231AE59|nr:MULTISPECIES: glutamate 5-kinase [unclassified Pseudoalteromonas]TMS80392.1 glutamate 5-kinase [Pseudoalteromonas sp. S554]GAA75832.1 glutamate 5-kinase 2 [Pseudoalteromonas sp. BSi20480]|tara:strand:+ start:5250 stop:6353 length:1104 start_codon:yes stop_codon:yes gene_type:complete